jgi:hypothetical protein
MRAFNPKRAVIFLLVSFSLTLILGACTPTNKDDPSPAAPKFSSLSEKAAACETKIRGQMAEKSIKLSPVAGLEAEIEAANAQVAMMDQVRYSTSISTEVESLELDHYSLSKTGYQQVQYNLRKAGSYVAAIMILEITIDNNNGQRDFQIAQKLNVSESCELLVTETSKGQIQKESAQDYSFFETKYFTNGETSTDQDRFSLPAGSSEIVNLWLNRDTLKEFPESANYYIPKLGVMRFVAVKMPAKKMLEFGQEFYLSFQKVTLLKDDKVFMTMEAGGDPDHEVNVTVNQNSNEWRVTKSIWEKLSLGTTRDTSSGVRSEFPKNYLYDHDSIQLVTKVLPEYDHFTAYWNVKGKTQEGDSSAFNFSMSEVSNPEIYDTVKPEDLVSNDTIQTTLPQIQAIAKEISAKEPLNRKGQIALILEYLGANYKYDYEMLKNNTVRPLTTEEALNRKTGVCQHYAVIFTAIARALKIPSRIVVGYSLSGASPGGHAWVEAEVSPSLWRVIEPQSRKGLEQTYTRFYFPMARGTFLEDKNAGMLEYSRIYANFKGVFKPAP